MKQAISSRTKQQQQVTISAILVTLLDKDRSTTTHVTDYKRNLDQNVKFHAMLAGIAHQAQWCDKWLKSE